MSEQNPNQLLIDNDGLRKQIAYLENMLRSALPAPAAPDYPKMELPESPVVAGQTAPEAARMDCEGVV